MNYQQLLKSALDDLTSSFEKDELAYLALTSKPELQLRDKIAFGLHRALSDKPLIVAREWNRIDLAILGSDQPEVFLELKLMYHFDAVEASPSAERYRRMVRDDIENSLERAAPKTDVYALLLSTHTQGKIARELKGIVKYLRRINRAHEMYSSQDVIRERVVNTVADWFVDAEVTRGSLDGGSAFGTRVDLDYWLVGPIKLEDST